MMGTILFLIVPHAVIVSSVEYSLLTLGECLGDFASTEIEFGPKLIEVCAVLPFAKYAKDRSTQSLVECQGWAIASPRQRGICG
jgi:hypothetical protein